MSDTKPPDELRPNGHRELRSCAGGGASCCFYCGATEAPEWRVRTMMTGYVFICDPCWENRK